MSQTHSDTDLLDGIPARQLCGEHIGLEAFVPRTDDHPTVLFGWYPITRIVHGMGDRVSICVADHGDVVHVFAPRQLVRIRVPLLEAA